MLRDSAKGASHSCLVLEGIEQCFDVFEAGPRQHIGLTAVLLQRQQFVAWDAAK